MNVEKNRQDGSVNGRLVALACLVLSLLLTNCASTSAPEDESVEVPKPIPLGEASSHPIIFRRVVFRIPSGKVLGEARRGATVIDELRWSRPATETGEFNIAVTDRFRELGYEMRDVADALFEPSSSVKVRYELAGILHDVKLDYKYKGSRNDWELTEGKGTADVVLEVRLHDMLKSKTVYSRRFEGHGKDQGREPNPTTKAVVDAISKSAADPEFVRLVARQVPDQAKASASEFERIDVGVCDVVPAEGLPIGLPSVMNSVVEVQVGSAIGTGVLISADGWILTADHIVSSASEIWVRLNNGVQLPAVTWRTDAQSDSALLKIEGRDYPCSRPRRSKDDLALGSEVFVINAALGEDRKPSVSRGVVAGFPEDEGQRFIQTDASVNPGSSGGPLFSEDGRVAGLTVAKVVAVNLEGLGFAKPIHDVLTRLAIRFYSN